MRSLKIIFLLIICFLFLQCSKRSNPTSYQSPIDLAKVEKKLVSSNNQFGLKLFREINKTEKYSNIFISPLSISMALGMTYNGTDGETKDAMHQTLDFGDLSIHEVNQCYRQMIDSLTHLDHQVEFDIANSIWYRLCKLLPREEFLSVCQNYLDAFVKGLNFDDPSTEDTINAWVEENTNGKIKNLLDDLLDSLTIMFLVNAIYFKGTWTYEFDEQETKDDWFFLQDGSNKRCKMMEQRGLYRYFENEAFEALDLPYGDGKFSMSIFLPHWGTDIDSLIAEFNQENLNSWLENLSSASLDTSDSVDIYLPKFKLEYGRGLNDVLTKFGMGIAFAPGAADFTKMYQVLVGYAWIDTVLHKTFIEVNEEGTEAAAATVVEISLGPPVGLMMKVNRPFVFIIREHQSQTILFIGKITEPNYE